MPAKTIYHHMKVLNARMATNYQRGFAPTRIVLLLTTTGRKSGLPRVTPLQFEEVDGAYYVASARGQAADWFKNIQANPNVHVQIREREFTAVAEPVTDPIRIADFIELRLKRHPVMIRLIMTLFDGLPLRFSRNDLKTMARKKALVILHPIQQHADPLETCRGADLVIVSHTAAGCMEADKLASPPSQLGVGSQPIPRPKLKAQNLAAALGAMQAPEMRCKVADLSAAIRVELDGVRQAVQLNEGMM